MAPPQCRAVGPCILEEVKQLLDETPALNQQLLALEARRREHLGRMLAQERRGQHDLGLLGETDLQQLEAPCQTPAYVELQLKPWGGKVLISSATCSESGWTLHARPNVAGRCGRGKASSNASRAAIGFLRMAVDLTSKP